MKNKFDFKIGKPRVGWVNVSLFHKDNIFMDISASGVYNPFYDLVDVLKNISKRKNGIYIWEIDQEGYDGIVKITVKGNFILLQTETPRDKKHEELPAFSLKMKKEYFLCKITTELEDYYKKNKREIIDDIYPLDFNITELRKIKW